MKDFTRKRIILLLVLVALVMFGYYQCSIMEPFFNENQKTLIQLSQKEQKEKNDIYYSGLDSEKYKSQSNQDELKLSAKSALLLDATSNRVLYEKDGFNEMPMASTTKIMTCILALENGNLDDVVTFSQKAASMPDVQLKANAGDFFTLRDLLYSLMLESHNDTAVAIAEHIGGSVEGFASMMNAKAEELGLEHTHFVTPNGLDADAHYTTAYDLAVLASYAIKNEDFIDITNTPSWTFKTIDQKKSYAVSNKDKFLYMMEGAFGIKTGFTSKAGYCFVGALRRGDRTYISVVLASGWPPHKGYKWKDTQALMNYGIKYFDFQNLEKYTKSIPEIPVKNGQESLIQLTTEDIHLPVLMKATDKVYVEYSVPSFVEAPIKSGSKIGSLRYYINDVFFKEYPIYSSNTVEKIDYRFCLKEIFSKLITFK